MAVKTQHSRIFEELMAEHRQQLLDSLITGTSRDNYDLTIGKIRGYDDAIRISEEADRKLSGDQ